MLAGAPSAALAQEDPSGVPPLSPTAPATETTPAPPPPPSTDTTTSTTSPSSSNLPNTGSDPRVLALLGMALLMSGIGLRLRAPDGRF